MSLNETTLAMNLRHIKDSFTDRYSHPACLKLVMCGNWNYELHDLLRHFYRHLPKKIIFTGTNVLIICYSFQFTDDNM